MEVRIEVFSWESHGCATISNTKGTRLRLLDIRSEIETEGSTDPFNESDVFLGTRDITRKKFTAQMNLGQDASGCKNVCRMVERQS